MTNHVTNFLGRCKDCDYALFATPESVREASNAMAGGPAVNIGNGQIMGRCTNGHRWFPLKRVEGTFSDKHQCDSRCLNAKGHDCTCSCGGVNHGRGHAVAVTVVPAEGDLNNLPTADLDDEDPSPYRAPRTATYEPGHVGAVGDRIRGEIEVARVLPINNGRTIYTFRATESGKRLKWFIGPEHNPHWEVGTTLTIRAKVRQHESSEQWGDDTILVYVEEVPS